MIPDIVSPFAPAEVEQEAAEAAEQLAEVVQLRSESAAVATAAPQRPAGGLLARATYASRTTVARAVDAAAGVRGYAVVLGEHLPSLAELVEQYKTVPSVPREIAALFWAYRGYGVVATSLTAAAHTLLWLIWYPSRLVVATPPRLPSLGELVAQYGAAPLDSLVLRSLYRAYGFGLVVPVNAVVQPLLWILRYPARLSVATVHTLIAVLLSLI
ncbi:hypothetical protein [Streptosporangium sp. NPDC001681]|uniref:hypothetical protein n=1 Tax=Streptosporangium sp. NPDC001681 TaxID=3154395 RepID=UPI0033238A94